MKKHLIASTALVAAGVLLAADYAVAQEKWSVTVGGSYFGRFGFTNFTSGKDLPAGPPHVLLRDKTRFDVHHQGNVAINARIPLDNGLVASFRVRYRTFSQSDFTQDVYGQLSGAFGLLRIGADSGASEAMVTGYTPWSTYVADNATLGTTPFVPMHNGFGGFTTSSTPGGPRQDQTAAAAAFRISDVRPTIENIFVDDPDGARGNKDKIIYITPRFAGFQVGVSYAPVMYKHRHPVGGFRSNVFNHGVSAAANYEGKFGDLGVGAGVGYEKWHKPRNATIGGVAGATRVTSGPSVIGGAVRLDWGGFRVSGAVRWTKGFTHPRRTPMPPFVTGPTAQTNLDGRVWEIGTSYRFGPNAVGAQYGNGRIIGAMRAPGHPANTERDQIHRVAVGYARTLGPGVRTDLTFHWAEHKGKSTAAAPGFAAVDTGTSRGWAIVSAFRFFF